MRLEVIRNPTDKDILAEVAAEHADHRAAFKIANVIKYLINFESVPDRDFNGMRCT
jgi:hypothetical protein